MTLETSRAEVKAMVEIDETGRPKRVETVPLPHHNRIVIMLVALSCLLMGVALGAVLRGISSATSEDHRIRISSTSASPDELSAAFARVAQRVEPTVVNISVREFAERSAFGREGTGSGVIVNPAGYIITNNHVVRFASKIRIKLQSGREYDGRVIGTDEETDLAVLKIDPPETLPAATMGDSDKLNVGDWVLAIGSPFGLEQTVTAGIISAKGRVTPEAVFQQFLQTDAAINPGNSGGPLVNLAGEVVGISTQIATVTGFSNGVGFALPSSTAVDIYNQLVLTGKVTRGYLGVAPEPLTPQAAREKGIKDGEGVVVKRLTGEDTPAARSGLQPGDVIISINGEKVKEVRQMVHRIASLPVGSTATIVYVRSGERRTASVKLEERPTQGADEVVEIPFDPHHKSPPETLPEKPKDKAVLGILGRTLTPDVARGRGLEGVRGMLVTIVEPGSVGHDSGIKINDVITEVNRKSVAGQDDFDRLLSKVRSGSEVSIKLLRKSAGIGPRTLTPVIVTLTMP